MWFFFLLVLAAGIGLWGFASAFIIRGIEEPRYVVMTVRDGYEIRDYEPHLVAEVEAEGALDEASNEGFSILSGYIFGANASKSPIAMTAPVGKRPSERIAMTAPVLADTSGNRHTITFSMPSKYALETIPVPDDKRIILREVPRRRVAALRFGWYATEARVAAMEGRLLSVLERDGLFPVGEPELARYDPPFAMPLLLRNEILVEIR